MSISESKGQPMAKCSNCGKPIWTIEPTWMPFCSQRCKELDLSKWLTESYGLPYEGDESSAPSEYSPHDDEER